MSSPALTATLVRFNASDMVTGVFAVLARRGFTSLYARGPRLDHALFGAYTRLVEISSIYGLKLRFCATPDSTTVFPSALYLLATIGLIHYYDGDLVLNTRALGLVELTDLPGEPLLYEDLACAFRSVYNSRTED